MTVEIFTDCNFAGTSSDRLDQDSPRLGEVWNDKISSIRIYLGTWEFFEHENYEGKSFRLHPDNYPELNNNGWNDVISSFKRVEEFELDPQPKGIVAENMQTSEQKYTVQAGDSLSTIAQKLYGDDSESSWRRIYEANKAVIGPDPTQLKLGMVLVMPASASLHNGGVAQRILGLVNAERSRVGAPALRLNPQLTSAAQAYTNLMVKFNQLSHQLPGQPPLGERVRQAGYRWSGVAENIAKGQQTPEQVMSSWMNSPGHRANLLAPKYQHLGVGYANRFWTQVFGRSA